MRSIRRNAWTAALLGLAGIAVADSPARGDFIDRLDANHNGLLEASELSDRVRPLIERAARHAGLDPSRPISIEKLRKNKSGDSNRSRSGDRRRDDDRGRDDDRRRRGSDDDAPPLVPGFGVSRDLPAVPGFGTDEADRDDEKDRRRDDNDRDRRRRRDRDRDDDRRRSRSSRDSDKDREEKYRRYAEGIIRRYDKNRNGRLEKDEWSGMRGEPEKADKNRDGVITREEMIERLLDYSRQRSRGGDDRNDSRSSSSSGSSAASDAAAAPHRFLTAVERLPEGLPDWFRDRDRDRDGQVMMHEYSSSWSPDKAREFARYDLNRDGVVTPREALPKEEEEEATKETEGRGEEDREDGRRDWRSWRRR
jgi:hypothetical protein